MQIGDDLIKARNFVDAAQAGLAGLNADDLSASSLRSIRDGALEMHARGIARSADCVLDGISNAHSPESLHGHIFSLKRLLNQYSEGLDEIAPVQTEVASIGRDTERASAKDTLLPLIKFAPAPEQRTALQFLTEFGNESRLVTHNANPGDISLESIMPAVTDQILSEARLAGKAVSVSYAVDNISVDEPFRSDIRVFLAELGTRFVKDVLGSPMSREAAGLPASGLINITLQKDDGRLSLRLECSGHSKDIKPIELESLSALTSRSGIFSVKHVGSSTVASLINVDIASDMRPYRDEPGEIVREAAQ